jgi:two-component system, LytTR family, sensor kinase
MKKSVKIAIHICFWLMIPMAFSLYDWGSQADSFFGIANHSNNYLQIIFENFQTLFVHPDSGSEVLSLSNLTWIVLNFFENILFPMATFYLFYGIFIPRLITVKDFRSKIIPVFYVLILPFIVVELLSYVLISVGWAYNYSLSLAYIITAFFAVSGSFFCIFENWVLKEKLAKQNLQSELALLKNQINPHFLFNTLNNIDSLIKSNAGMASVMLIKLSEILRYMIYDTNADRVQLSNEIKHIESYIGLQKLQFANQELVSLTVNGNPDNISIAPMLFIPFVENAFKHCTDKSIIDAIQFTFTIHDNSVNFESANLSDNTMRMHKDEASGVGLNIVKRRLELLYPGRHTLIIKEDNKTFAVSLSVNTHEH